MHNMTIHIIQSCKALPPTDVLE